MEVKWKATEAENLRLQSELQVNEVTCVMVGLCTGVWVRPS